MTHSACVLIRILQVELVMFRVNSTNLRNITTFLTLHFDDVLVIAVGHNDLPVNYLTHVRSPGFTRRLWV